MAETVQDLLVKITSDGVEETTENLEEQEGQFEDMADTAQEETGRLEDFASKWQGAMGILVASLSVAAAGLASQIPVVGELVSGLVAVIDALALKMDQRLRPVLQPITDLLFGLAQSINNADGILGSFIGALGVVATAIGGVVAALTPFLGATGAVTAVFNGFVSLGGAVVSAFTSIASAIGTAITTFTSAAVAVGALVGVLGVAALEVTGVLDAVQNFGAYLANTLPGILRDIGLVLISVFVGPLAVIGAAILGFVRGTLEGGFKEGVSRAIDTVSRIVETFIGAWERTFNGIVSFLGSVLSDVAAGARDIVDRVSEIISNLAEDGRDAGESLVQGIIDGFQAKIQQLKNAASNLAQTIRDRLPSSPAEKGPLSDLDKVGPGLVETISGGIEANVGTAEQASGSLAAGVDPRGDMGGGGGQGGPATIQMDGRDLSEDTGRYRSDMTSRRGRFS